MEQQIRELVEQGLTQKAMELTGKAFALSGEVVEGNKIGRTLGYPTANLDPAERDVIPAQGVYAAMVNINNEWYKSMVNIGIRPTLNLHRVTIEAHLFDFSKDIYGQPISIHFLARVRDEMRFSSLSELREQLDTDKEVVRKSIAGLGQHIKPAANQVVWVRSS